MIVCKRKPMQVRCTVRYWCHSFLSVDYVRVFCVTFTQQVVARIKQELFLRVRVRVRAAVLLGVKAELGGR